MACRHILILTCNYTVYFKSILTAGTIKVLCPQIPYNRRNTIDNSSCNKEKEEIV